MKCIYCGGKTQVVNSRLQKKTNSIWRRRKCYGCQGVFTSWEESDLALALLFKSDSGNLGPFQRDYLFVSIYEACRHRKSSLEDARALTDTIVGKLYRFVNDASVSRSDVIAVTSDVLKRFDRAAAVSYRAFHPY